MAKTNQQEEVTPVESTGYIDYKDTVSLKHHLTKFNRIIPRKYSGTSLKTQKKIATAIKRARYMALLPYVVDPRHTTHVDYENKTTPVEPKTSSEA